MRTRLLLLLGVGVAVAVVAVMVVVTVVVVGGPDGPTGADRSALAAASREASALDGVVSLSSDPDRWGRLVAGGGAEVADLLDAAQPELGRSDDPIELVGDVVAPFVDGDDVDDDVVLALGRWTWPLLATDLSSAVALDRAGDVIARADEGDREAVTAAVTLARLHRTLTGPADPGAIATWRSELAGAALSAPVDDVDDRAGALRSGDLQDQPAALLRNVLAAWGPDEPRTTEAARAVIASDSAAAGDEPLARAGSAITIASYLAVIDETEDTAAAGIVARLAAGDDPLTEDDTTLVALEDALLDVDDPALTPATETATLLRTA